MPINTPNMSPWMSDIPLMRPFLLASALALASCASMSMQFTKFEESTSDERARLRVTSDALVKGVPAHRCIDWSAPGAGTIFGGIVGSSGFRGRSLGMTDPADKSAAELYIDANKPLTLVLATTPESRYQCTVAASFIPAKGKDYHAAFIVEPSICQIRIVSADEPKTPVGLTKANPC